MLVLTEDAPVPEERVAPAQALWDLLTAHREGLRREAIPVSALLILLCTFLGHWAVLVAGLVAAATVATGVSLTAREARRQPVA